MCLGEIIMGEYRRYDDASLIALVRLEDQQAFTELYARYSGILLRFTLKTLKDADDAEDLVHDVFATLWERRTTLEIHTSVSSFLYRAVFNKTLNHIKRVRFFENYIERLQLEPEPSESITDNIIYEKELTEKFEYQLNELPPKMREAFEYSRLHGMSHRAIGEKMNVSTNTVKSHVQSALKIIKKGIIRSFF